MMGSGLCVCMLVGACVCLLFIEADLEEYLCVDWCIQ